MRNAGLGMLAGAGALAVGATTYFLWPAPKPKEPARRAMVVAPLASADGLGAVWLGTF